jgi:hypothetical protein
VSNPWHDKAPELAKWALARYFVRFDRYGGYYYYDGGTKPRNKPPKSTEPNCVNLRLLERHFRAHRTEDVIGAHTLNLDDVGLYCAADIDAHPGVKVDPVANEKFALSIDADLRRFGFRPLTYESNGKGGFHVVVFFSERVKGIALFRFGKWIARNFSVYGFEKVPETFPKQAKVSSSGKGFGGWLRVIGRHHSYDRDFWPRVWDGTAWLEGELALSHVLSFGGDSPELIDPFSRFNRASTMQSIGDLLVRHGWEFHGERDDRHDYRRPGKKEGEGQSGNIKIFEGVPLFYPFTNATELTPDKALNPSQLRGKLEFKGNHAALAEVLWEEIFGSPLSPKKKMAHEPIVIDDAPSANGSIPPSAALPIPPIRPASPPQTNSAIHIILAQIYRKYRPDFRRDELVHAKDGRMLTAAAMGRELLDIELVEWLKQADDAPIDKNNKLKESAIPGLFKTWFPVAFGEMFSKLPLEIDAKLEPDSVFDEEFRDLVRKAMFIEVAFVVESKEKREASQQRESMITWCVMEREKGHDWYQIRSKLCWVKKCRNDEKPVIIEHSGECIPIKVAIRHELFSQLGANRHLVSLPFRTFSALAEKYNVGTSSRSDRPKGLQAVVFNQEFLTTIISQNSLIKKSKDY